jgi:hypothetical protein
MEREEAHQARASRPSRLKARNDAVALSMTSDFSCNKEANQVRALSPSRRNIDNEKKAGKDNIEDASTLRRTSWRRYRQDNDPGIYGNDSDNQLDRDEDEESHDDQPGAVRMPGHRAELYDDDNTIAIGTINGDDQYFTNRNLLNPITRENQPVMDASVPTAEVTPATKERATETTGGRHVWICLCVLVLVVGAAVGVAFGLTGGGDGGDDGSPVASKNLTDFECSGFESIDPDIESMDESTFARYTDLLLTLVPKLLPDYSEPMKGREYCSAAHLALVWLASDDLDSGYPQQVLENRFLLAIFFVKSNGYSWSNYSKTGWLSESPECGWTRIQCDEFGNIVKLGQFLVPQRHRVRVDLGPVFTLTSPTSVGFSSS